MFGWFKGNKDNDHKGRGMGMMNAFFKTDLTDDQKTALKELQESHRDEMKQFMEDNKDKITETATQDALKALREKHMNALLPYVAADKQEEFKTMHQNAPMGKMRKMGK